MKAEHHAIVTVPLSLAIWQATGNFYYFLMCLFLGVFVDVDHVFDYIRENKHFSMRGMFIKSYKGQFKKLTVIFHCWEFIPLAWVVGYFLNNFQFSVVFTLAYLAHMIPDQLMNNTRPWGYSLIYRIAVGFKMKKLFDTPKGGNHPI